MYSLNYSAKDGWTLWADTNLGHLLVNQGSFRHCWNFRTMMDFVRRECIKLMSTEEWLEQYSKVKEMIEELNSICCKDDYNFVCSKCKYSKECKIVSAVNYVMNI